MRSLFVSHLHGLVMVSSIAGLLALGCGQASSGLITTAATERLYQDEATIEAKTDPAFTTYWGDQAEEVWWTGMKPIVRTGRFTDADGRRLVVTTIRAGHICNYMGCPVRIQTEYGERLLDRAYACDLTEDHHVSADGRSFIACDVKFAIPKRGADLRQAPKGNSAPPAPISESPPKQPLYSLERVIPNRSDPAFVAYWKDKADDILWDAKPAFHHTISVGHFTDARDRKLTVTTIYTMAECGIQICPFRIYTASGELLLEAMGCNAKEFHRISSDRRYIITCGEAFLIPEKAAVVEVVAAKPMPVRVPLPKLQAISYDSGAELESRKDYVLTEYWSDRIGQIDWTAPVARRGSLHNASLPSADGRLLYLTMMQTVGCGAQCPLRVFTAQHRKIMDVLVCSDRAQHGVSIDRRSFVACGESFAIPQVDDRSAIIENASPGSDPEAAVEVVRRERMRSANAPKPVLVDSAYHNRSEMLVSEWKDATVEITYNRPRSGLPVAQGTLLFRGSRDGARYSGTAYTFKAGCPPAPYAVTGIKDRKGNSIVLTGAAPRRDPYSCGVIGATASSGHSKLVFDTSFYGDE